jgi:hydrogenase nickel incorporation protein HypA/HybF
MHEYSIVEALVSKVTDEAARHGATHVSRVRVQIGEMSGVEPELLATAYDTFRERTICEKAELVIVHIPAVWACCSCHTVGRRGELLRCAACGDPIRLSTGDEIVLDQIEMEVA